MKHLFIINPKAAKILGRERDVIAGIEAFFGPHSGMEHDIYITRYSRDAVGVIKQYAAATRGLLRIYAVGGTGTLFEAVNGAIGIPNVQIACYPFGQSNAFIRYFGEENVHMFKSLRSLTTSSTTPIDVIRCGNNYATAFCAIGMEAAATLYGDRLKSRTPFSGDICYLGAGAYAVLKNLFVKQNYRITLDGESRDGDYFTILAANAPCYGISLNSAVDAHPNDGYFDVYMGVFSPPLKILSVFPKYTSGRYRKIPEVIEHFRGRTMNIASDSIMCAMMDGEIFYDGNIELEIIPKAIDFVCPDGIDTTKLPKIYGQMGGETVD